MSSPYGAVDQNRIMLNKQARQAYEAEQARLAEQARIASAEREQAQRREQEAREREQKRPSNSGSAPRNPNAFFNPQTGAWEFVVTPTYEDITGSRAVTKSEINPGFLETPEGASTKAFFEGAERDAQTQQDFQIYRDLQGQGIDPGQLTTVRDAGGNITRAEGTKNDLKAVIQPDNSIRFQYTELVPVQEQSSGPTKTEYLNPQHNQQFSSKRVGDIINAELAKGEKGLFASRKAYDYAEVKNYLAAYKPAQTYNHYFVNFGGGKETPAASPMFGPTNPRGINRPYMDNSFKGPANVKGDFIPLAMGTPIGDTRVKPSDSPLTALTDETGNLVRFGYEASRGFSPYQIFKDEYESGEFPIKYKETVSSALFTGGTNTVTDVISGKGFSGQHFNPVVDQFRADPLRAIVGIAGGAPYWALPVGEAGIAAKAGLVRGVRTIAESSAVVRVGKAATAARQVVGREFAPLRTEFVLERGVISEGARQTANTARFIGNRLVGPDVAEARRIAGALNSGLVVPAKYLAGAVMVRTYQGANVAMRAARTAEAELVSRGMLGGSIAADALKVGVRSAKEILPPLPAQVELAPYRIAGAAKTVAENYLMPFSTSVSKGASDYLTANKVALYGYKQKAGQFVGDIGSDLSTFGRDYIAANKAALYYQRQRIGSALKYAGYDAQIIGEMAFGRAGRAVKSAAEPFFYMRFGSGETVGRIAKGYRAAKTAEAMFRFDNDIGSFIGEDAGRAAAAESARMAKRAAGKPVRANRPANTNNMRNIANDLDRPASSFLESTAQDSPYLQKRTSRAALETITEYDMDKSLQAITKRWQKALAETGVKTSFELGSADTSSNALYGYTGMTKKGKKDRTAAEEIQYQTYATDMASIEQSATKRGGSTRTNLETLPAVMPEINTRREQGLVPGLFPALKPITGSALVPRTTPTTDSKQTPVMIPLEAAVTTPVSITGQMPEVVVTTKTRPPVLPFYWPQGTERQRRRRRSDDPLSYMYGKTLWRVDPLIKINKKELDRLFGLSSS